MAVTITKEKKRGARRECSGTGILGSDKRCFLGVMGPKSRAYRRDSLLGVFPHVIYNSWHTAQASTRCISRQLKRMRKGPPLFQSKQKWRREKTMQTIQVITFSRLFARTTERLKCSPGRAVCFMMPRCGGQSGEVLSANTACILMAWERLDLRTRALDY